jgi:thioredoxin reductase (NADPH)
MTYDFHEKVTIMPGTRLKSIEGTGKVTGVRVHPRGGKENLLPVDGAFVYLQGGQPITDYLMGQLETLSEGCLVVDSEMRTTIPGIFAVGDILCSHIKQAVIATADGVIAAAAVDKYVHHRNQVQIDWN